jgi:VCBS repeat-containing protein
MPTENTIDGTAAADTVTFTATSTTVNAGEGANTITGTSGNNTINAGDGADTITVTSGNNTINAGAGANTITATSGINIITTGDGADTITTGGLAGGGNTINAGNGANTITTGAGNDTVTGGSGVDTVTTGAGDDVVYAGNGANTITTGAGSDTVYSGVDVDTITTGAGDDTIHIKGGTDTISAGADNDTLIADLSLATSAVSLNALAGTAATGYAGNLSGLGIATFAGVENFAITSGGFNDVIATGDGTDLVHAGAGSDTVNLGGGADEAIYTMAANTGATDVYQGGDGVDTLTLEFTEAEWLDDNVQADIAGYQAHLASGRSDSFEFAAFGLTASQFEALNVIVDGVALDPNAEAADDVADLNEDNNATQFASVLDNDAAEQAYSVTLISAPSEGVLSFNTGLLGSPDGSYSFDPNGEFEDLADGETRDVSFVYEVQDAFRGATQATVTITVTGTNDAPTVAAALTETTNEDGAAFSVDLLASAVDADNGETATLNVQNVTGLVGGITLNGNTLDVDPVDAAFQYLGVGDSEVITVNYEVADAQGATVAQTATITINGTNDAPEFSASVNSVVAFVDTIEASSGFVFSANWGFQTYGTNSYGYSSVGQELHVNNVNSVYSGTAVLDIPGITAAGTYTVNVDVGNYNNTGLATISDVGLQSGGVFLATTQSTIPSPASGQKETWVLTYEVTQADINAGLSFGIAVPATGVWANASFDNLIITTEVSSVDGVVVGSITELADNSPGETTANLFTDGMIAFTDVDLTDTHTVSVAANGAGYLGDLTAVVSDDTGAVTWAFEINDGAVDHLAEDETLTQSYVVTVDDGEGGLDAETVTITVAGTNDSPIAFDLTLASGPSDAANWTYNPDNGHYYRVVEEGSTFAEAISGSDALGGYLATITSASEQAFIEQNDLVAQTTDATWIGGLTNNAGQSATWTWVTGPEAGQQITYANWNPGEPGGGFNASTQYAQIVKGWGYTWNDSPNSPLPGNGIADGYLVEWGGRPADAGFDEDTVLTIDTATLLANDTDVDNDAEFSVTAVAALSAAGVLVSLSGTTISYDPTVVFNYLAAGESATDTFTYTITDEFDATDTATVTLTVQGTNDAPTITSAAAIIIDENTTAVVQVTASDADTVGTLSYALLAGDDAGQFTIDAQSGVLALVNPADYEAPDDVDANGTYDLTVVVSDGVNSSTQAMQVAVADVNEVPTIFDMLAVDGDQTFQATTGVDYFVYNMNGTSRALHYWDKDTLTIEGFDANQDKLIFINVDATNDGVAQTEEGRQYYDHNRWGNHSEQILTAVSETQEYDGSILARNKSQANNGTYILSDDTIDLLSDSGSHILLDAFAYPDDSALPEDEASSIQIYLGDPGFLF